MKTISKIIESDQRIVTQAQRTSKTSTKILKYLDVLAKRLGKIAEATNQTISIEIVELNVALAVKNSHPVNLSVVGAQTENGDLSLSFQSIANDTVFASAKIPAEAFKNKSQIVYSFLFRNDNLFQTEKQLTALDTDAPLISQVSSKVLAVSVGSRKIENLTSPVMLTFKKSENIPSNADNICTFWYPRPGKFALNNHFCN